MSTETSEPKSITNAGGNQALLNPFLPLALFGCSFLMFLSWQVTRITRERDTLQTAISQREPAVVQAEDSKMRLEKLAMELLEVAKTNSEARKIVAKYNIQYTPGKKAENAQ